jgi:L,D-peptidoglycan transpeptidase YkuD (ErfK/YbiS/YcfS/YnhG family)
LATPTGRFALRPGYFRADKITPPPSTLPLTPIQQNYGWCDDVNHADYNRLITLPHPARHEQLWRLDDVYDIVIPLAYNDAPIIAGAGSAIFFHLAHADYRGTEGCVAIARADMLALLPQLNESTILVI